jgi:hypothetical protein
MAALRHVHARARDAREELVVVVAGAPAVVTRAAD